MDGWMGGEIGCYVLNRHVLGLLHQDFLFQKKWKVQAIKHYKRANFTDVTLVSEDEQ